MVHWSVEEGWRSWRDAVRGAAEYTIDQEGRDTQPGDAGEKELQAEAGLRNIAY